MAKKHGVRIARQDGVRRATLVGVRQGERTRTDPGAESLLSPSLLPSGKRAGRCLLLQQFSNLKREKANRCTPGGANEGAGRNRTGVHGFAIRCLTTWLQHRERSRVAIESGGIKAHGRWSRDSNGRALIARLRYPPTALMTVKKLIHFEFPAQLVQQPLLYRLNRQFDVVFNIRGASVTDSGGFVALELEGEAAEVERVLEYLRNENVEVGEGLGNVDGGASEG